MKATHHEARDRAADARGRERAAAWLSSQLEERAQIAANVMSQRWTGWSCVGRWEDPISSSDLRKIAAALVIGQATVGLMLSDLISDDVYGRLLEPWHSPVSRVSWQPNDKTTVDDRAAQVPAVASREPAAVTSTRGAVPNDDVDARLATLLELVHQADGIERISYRDQVAAFGRDAIEPMSEWLADP